MRLQSHYSATKKQPESWLADGGAEHCTRYREEGGVRLRDLALFSFMRFGGLEGSPCIAR